MMNFTYLLFASCMIITLTACVDSQDDLQEYIAQVKKTASSKVEPIPVIPQFKGEEYTAENLRSPFMSSGQGGGYPNTTLRNKNLANKIQQQPRPDATRPREYLEKFPLSSLTMVGTLSKPNMRWGLVRDEQGMIYAVKIGDYLGQDSGEIIAITPNQIRITETVPNGIGGWMQTRVALMLVVPNAATDEQQTHKQLNAPKTPKLNDPGAPLEGQKLEQHSQLGNR